MRRRVQDKKFSEWEYDQRRRVRSDGKKKEKKQEDHHQHYGEARKPAIHSEAWFGVIASFCAIHWIQLLKKMWVYGGKG